MGGHGLDRRRLRRAPRRRGPALLRRRRRRDGRVRLLIDTHVFLWWRVGRAMRAEAMEAIRTADDVVVSAASAWEVSVKAAAGKLRPPASFADGVAQSGFVPLPINLVHAAVAGELPPHHRDPFDRMLVAQARAERLTLVSHDRRLEPYGMPIIWA